MKFKKIVGFGDSWMWGDELLDPALAHRPDAHPVLIENTKYREQNCFLGQLGQHYNVPVENFGIPGGSLQSTIWNYLWWKEHTVDDNCLVLVALTDAWRQSFYNPKHIVCDNDQPWSRYVHNTWLHTNGIYSDEWVDTMKHLLVLSDCSSLQKLNYQQAVWFFDGQSHTQSLLQFCSITPPCLINAASLIWPDRSLNSMLSTEYLAKNRHPNELGHKLIADNLISVIDSRIIKG